MPSSDSNNSSSNEPRPSGQGPHKGRAEKGPASQIIWYVLIIFALGVAAHWLFVKGSPTKEISSGDFELGLKDGKYSAKNVFKFTIGKELITFQSAPDGEKSSGEEKAEPITKYVVPIVGISDTDRDRIRELVQKE